MAQSAIRNRAHHFLLVRKVQRVFRRGRAGSTQAELLGLCQHSMLARQGPSRSPVVREEEITSSISCLLAAMRGKPPFIARFISHAVIIRRLISLVASKIGLLRASRYARSTGYSCTWPYPPWFWTAGLAITCNIPDTHTFTMEHSTA